MKISAVVSGIAEMSLYGWVAWTNLFVRAEDERVFSGSALRLSI
ncbi:MAG: hypothetical protein ACC630_01350 [Nitrospinota bacterium]